MSLLSAWYQKKKNAAVSSGKDHGLGGCETQVDISALSPLCFRTLDKQLSLKSVLTYKKENINFHRAVGRIKEKQRM